MSHLELGVHNVRNELLSFLQYIRECLAREVRPRLSLKPFQELLPEETEGFIRPVHASTQPTPSQYEQKGAYGRLAFRPLPSLHGNPSQMCMQ